MKMNVKIENTRKQIKQHPELYEGAIKRHGQYVRWKKGMPCFCIRDRGTPEPDCKKCHGRGTITYSVDKIDKIETGISEGGNLIRLEGNISSIKRLVNSSLSNIKFHDINENRIILSDDLIAGEKYRVEYKEDISKSYTGVADYEGRGIIRATIPPLIEEDGEFLGEIIKVDYVRNNTKNRDINILDYWDDLILTDSSIGEDDELEIKCDYLEPFDFLLQSISFKQKKEMVLAGQTADMMMTIPGNIVIGSSDIIMLIKPVQMISAVGTFKDPYRLPAMSVREIIRLEDEFGLIEDAEIIRNNEIKWNSRKPTGRFSISYTYSPTFRVDDDLPSLRYSGNKVLPKKLMLKKWDLETRNTSRPVSSFSSPSGIY